MERDTTGMRKPQVGMKKQIYDLYKREYQYGALNVGSKCNTTCFYCSQYWNPPDLLPSYKGFLTIDEIKHFLTFVPDKHIECIGAGDIRVSMGEFFYHPQATEILQLLYADGYAVNAVATNGLELKSEQVDLLEKLIFESSNKRAIDGEISLHLTNYDATKNALDLLDQSKIPYHVYIVITREEIDNGLAKSWIEQLQKHNPTRILMERVGYTKFAPQKIVDRMKISKYEVWLLMEQWQEEFPKIPLVYFSLYSNRGIFISESLRYLVDNYKMHTDKPNPSFLFLIAKGVEDIFESIVNALLPTKNFHVKTVENKTFGGSIDASGLLLVDDYIAAIDSVDYDSDFLVLPKESFNYHNPNIDAADLQGTPAISIAEKYNKPMMWC